MFGILTLASVFPIALPSNLIAANIFLIALLGLSTSYTDLRFGKIPNKAVFPAMAAGIALALLANANPVPFLLNGAFAFLFGFVLFLARLWSAADSKLFLAFALLFPMPLYTPFFPLFPGFSLILNSFIPAFIALFAFALLRTSGKEKINALKHSFQPKQVASIAIILFAFYWLLSLSFSFLQIPLDFFLIVLLLFLFIAGLEALFPQKLVFACALISLPFLFFECSTILQAEFLSRFLLILLAMLLLRFFVLYLGFSAFGRRVEIKNLKQGMVLLEGVYEKKGCLEKKKLFFPSIINAMQDIKTNYVFNLSPKGLTPKNLALLREKNKNDFLDPKKRKDALFDLKILVDRSLQNGRVDKVMVTKFKVL